MHNHNVVNNTMNGNCYSNEFRDNNEPYTYANYLNNIGYNTFHAGKYLNEYGNYNEITIPIGWDYWYSLSSQILYYNYCISNMGERECFGNNPNEYISIMIKNKALKLDFLKTINEKSDPFLLVI